MSNKNPTSIKKKSMREMVEALEDLAFRLDRAWKNGLGQRDETLLGIIEDARFHAAFLVVLPVGRWTEEYAQETMGAAKEAFELGAERLTWIDPDTRVYAYRIMEASE